MEILKYTIYFITIIISVILLLKSYNNLVSNKKTNINFKKIFLIIIISLLFEINNLYCPNNIKGFSSFVILIILYKLYYQNKNKDVLIYSSFIEIIMICLELLFSIIMLNNLENVKILNSHYTVKVSITLLVFITLYGITEIKKLQQILRKFKLNIEKIHSIDALLFLSIIMLTLFAVIYSKDFNNYFNVFIIILATIYISYSTYMVIKKQVYINGLERKNKELLNLYKNYIETSDSLKELKHNLKNDMCTLKTVVPKNKQTLINNLIKKYNLKCEWLNDMGVIPKGLEGIIYLKKNEAESKNIKLIINNATKQEIAEKDFLDVSDIIGIMLDNAIEASIVSKNNYVVIDIRDEKDIMYIKIINKFKNSVDTSEIGNKNYSTKVKKSGIGLNYIKKIKNNNIKNSIEIKNDLFIAKVMYSSKND